MVRRLSFLLLVRSMSVETDWTNSGSTKMRKTPEEERSERAGHFFFNAETGMGAGEAAQPYACKCMVLFNSSVLYDAYFGSRCTSTAAIAEP